MAKKKQQYDPERAGAAFDKLASRHISRSYDEVFYDILDSLLYIATVGKEFEKEYTAAIELYGKDELEEFIQFLVDASDDFNDVLGEIYEHIQSAGKASMLGQYFTPQHISDMMAAMVGVKDNGEPMAMADPAGCGSGRNILAMAKHVAASRWKHQFFGIDIDRVCVKMATINCWLQVIPAMIVHGDGLSFKFWDAYEVVLNWSAEDSRWYSFVIKQPAATVEALEALARNNLTETIANEANKARVAKLEAHRAEREAAAKQHPR